MEHQGTDGGIGSVQGRSGYGGVDGKSTMDSFGGTVDELKKTVTKAAHDTFDQVSRSGSKMIGDLAESGREQIDSLESYIKKYPIRCAVIGVGVGIFLGSRLCK